MSEMLLAKEGIPAQVVEFAQGVIDAQGPEIDRMNAMLEAWGQQPVTDSGAWGPWTRWVEWITARWVA